ncbi:hypothetical protein F443_13081 [Phytophthora nicotianae P1569]|uniref:Uncharacterized protein n=1 Tax=Phytophthora nicotianae P1569 TaxID=1317065 RepID=V9ER15_PHYNI|nr:hypothetical protein F443_13081 [Phytophthora nicotianae P1569]
MPPGRRRVTGNGRKELNHARTCFSNSRKLETVLYFENHNVNETLDKFFSGLDDHAREQKRKLLYQWRKEREKLTQLCATPRLARLKYVRSSYCATILPADAERELVQWINTLRKDGAPVSATMLELQAKETATDYHEADAVAIKFAVDVQQKMLELRATKVYNADQTGVLFEYLPKHSINKTGSKTVWVRGADKDKERFSVMLLADSDCIKYPLYVVLKSSRSTVDGGDEANWKYRRGFGIHVWKGAKTIMEETDLQLYANPTAWWKAQIHVEFLKGNFGNRSMPRQPILLLVDDFSGHWTPDVMAYAKEIDVYLMNVPPSCTAVCQPADIA